MRSAQTPEGASKKEMKKSGKWMALAEQLDREAKFRHDAEDIALGFVSSGGSDPSRVVSDLIAKYKTPDSREALATAFVEASSLDQGTSGFMLSVAAGLRKARLG